jgi:hypothetical protein
MKNKISRLVIVGGFAVAFIAGAASRSIPGSTGVTSVTAQEKHEAMADMRNASGLLQQARGLLAGAPGSFGGHRDKALKRVDEALAEVNEAMQTRAHENH